MEWYKRKRKVKKIKGKKWGIVQFFFFKGGKIEGEKKGRKGGACETHPRRGAALRALQPASRWIQCNICSILNSWHSCT